VTSDESAWLVTVQEGHWFIEASYD
jgi:hypothetical protein